MGIIIRQATLEDKDAIFEFIKSTYDSEQTGSSKFKIPERWIWQFERNPFNNEKDNKLPIWLAIDNDKIVGQYCAIPGNMSIYGKFYNMAWGCDLIVKSNYRGFGIAYQLHNAFNNHYELTAGIGFANATRKIWEKSGAQPLPEMSLYWYLMKVNKFFIYHYIKERIVHRKTLFKVINFLFKYMFLDLYITLFVNSLIFIKRIIKFRFKYNIKSDITEIFEFDDDFDNFINKTIDENNFIIPRNSKFLNWKFFQNDQLKYNVFILKKSNEIKGYIALRKPHPVELKIGSIVDFYASKEDTDTFYDLIIYAINYLKDSVFTIQCLTSVKEFKKILQKIGFITVKKYKPLVSISNPSLNEKLKNKIIQCYLTQIDHDLDQIEPI